jgi:hypothetical protein
MARMTLRVEHAIETNLGRFSLPGKKGTYGFSSFHPRRVAKGFPLRCGIRDSRNLSIIERDDAKIERDDANLPPC